MEISERKKDDIVIFDIRGDMVGGPGARVLSEKLREYVGEKRVKFIVNLTDTGWMNSSGIGILMGGLYTVRGAGGQLKLLKPGKKIRQLLRATKLDRVFDMYEDENDALESF